MSVSSSFVNKLFTYSIGSLIGMGPGRLPVHSGDSVVPRAVLHVGFVALDVLANGSSSNEQHYDTYWCMLQYPYIFNYNIYMIQLMYYVTKYSITYH